MTLRVAMIGYGFMGAAHSVGWRQAPRVFDLPEDVVYKMIKAFYDKRDELVKIDPGFTPMAKDFVGMQVQGINSTPQIAVHPGLAKFLKEHKAWNDKWKIAGGS